MALSIEAIKIMETGFVLDEVFGERLLISETADKRELNSNLRAARAILSSYSDVDIRINSHTYAFGIKNPEYTICELLGDRKGVMSEKGITAGFKSAKKQGCKIVVIDLDENVLHLDPFSLSKYISRRKSDFHTGLINNCYVVFCGRAVRVNADVQTRREIESLLETLRP